MEYGNTAIVFMVIAVVSCVLGLSFFGVYYLEQDRGPERSLRAILFGRRSDQGK